MLPPRARRKVSWVRTFARSHAPELHSGSMEVRTSDTSADEASIIGFASSWRSQRRTANLALADNVASPATGEESSDPNPEKPTPFTFGINLPGVAVGAQPENIPGANETAAVTVPVRRWGRKVTKPASSSSMDSAGTVAYKARGQHQVIVAEPPVPVAEGAIGTSKNRPRPLEIVVKTIHSSNKGLAVDVFQE